MAGHVEVRSREAVGLLSVQLATISGRVRNKQKMLREIGVYMANSTRAAIREQRAPDGTAWPQSKRAAHEGTGTLRDTDRLYNAVAFRVWRDQVRVFFDDREVARYASILEDGWKHSYVVRARRAKALLIRVYDEPADDRRSVEIDGRRYIFAKSARIPPMPPRPILGLRAYRDDERHIRQIVLGWIVDGSTVR